MNLIFHGCDIRNTAVFLLRYRHRLAIAVPVNLRAEGFGYSADGYHRAVVNKLCRNVKRDRAAVFIQFIIAYGKTDRRIAAL